MRFEIDEAKDRVEALAGLLEEAKGVLDFEGASFGVKEAYARALSDAIEIEMNATRKWLAVLGNPERRRTETLIIAVLSSLAIVAIVEMIRALQ